MAHSTPKYFELAAGITKRMEEGHFRVGDRLPPIRTLADRHGVSGATMNRSIQLLVQEGLLSSRPGGGTYVARLPSPPQPTEAKVEGVIGFVLAQHAGMGRFDPGLLAGLQTLLKAQDKRVEFEQFAYPFEPEAVGRLQPKKWQGLILTGNVQDHHVKAVRETNIPFVVTGNTHLSEPCDSVRFDLETSFRNFFARLLARGYRKIGVVVGRIDYEGNKLMAQACVAAHAAAGVPFDPSQIEVDDRDTGEGSLDRLVARMGKPEVIVSQGYPWPQILRRLRSHGLEPRRNVVLAGMADEQLHATVRLNIRLEMPEAAWYEATARTLMERMRRGLDQQTVQVLLPVMQTIDGDLPDPEALRSEAVIS